jgi:copper chaperone CopZ
VVSLFKRKEKIEISVKGMTCGHCEMRVKKALLSVAGVQEAEASHEREQAIVTVKTKDTVKVDDLVAAVQAAGYKAALPDSA